MRFVAAALKAVAEARGEERLVELAREAKLDLPQLLAFDPEFDGDMPPPADFLKQQGLAVLA